MKPHMHSDDVLYHYCSTETLYKILENASLQLTHIRYMNDCKELSWLFELAKHVVLRRKQFAQSDPEFTSGAVTQVTRLWR